MTCPPKMNSEEFETRPCAPCAAFGIGAGVGARRRGSPADHVRGGAGPYGCGVAADKKCYKSSENAARMARAGTILGISRTVQALDLSSSWTSAQCAPMPGQYPAGLTKRALMKEKSKEDFAQRITTHEQRRVYLGECRSRQRELAKRLLIPLDLRL